MRLIYLYLLYLALVFLGLVVYQAKRWGAIDFMSALVGLTLIVFLLYLFTLFLAFQRGNDQVTEQDIHLFLRRRKGSILLFLFALSVLACLIFVSHSL